MMVTRTLVLLAALLVACLAASVAHAGRLPSAGEKQALAGSGGRPGRNNPYVLLSDIASLATPFTGDLAGHTLSDSTNTTVTISGAIKATTGKISSGITSLGLHSTVGNFRLTPEGDLDNQADGSAKMLGDWWGGESQYVGLGIKSANLRTALVLKNTQALGSPEITLVNDGNDVLQIGMAGSNATAAEGVANVAFLFSTKPIEFQPDGGATTLMLTSANITATTPIAATQFRGASGTEGVSFNTARVNLMVGGVSGLSVVPDFAPGTGTNRLRFFKANGTTSMLDVYDRYDETFIDGAVGAQRLNLMAIFYGDVRIGVDNGSGIMNAGLNVNASLVTSYRPFKTAGSGQDALTGTATTKTVTIGATMPDANYHVSATVVGGTTPAPASFLVTNRTTTTFDVTVAANTGTITFTYLATAY